MGVPFLVDAATGAFDFFFVDILRDCFFVWIRPKEHLRLKMCAMALSAAVVEVRDGCS
jgi:hypothetical protein